MREREGGREEGEGGEESQGEREDTGEKARGSAERKRARGKETENAHARAREDLLRERQRAKRECDGMKTRKGGRGRERRRDTHRARVSSSWALPGVCVADVIGALAVWRQNIKKKLFCSVVLGCKGFDDINSTRTGCDFP